MMKEKQQMNLMELMEEYGTDEKCREYLEHLRWPDGLECPHCNSNKISHVYSRNQYDCDSCGYQFSVTSETIFHDSHLLLSKWLAAVYLMVESKKGISANQMKRTLNVSYKTAWYLCHRIRNAIMTETNKKLNGIVEVDETWVGGKMQNVGHGFKGNKILAVGAIERQGDIVLQTIKHADRDTLHKFIHSNTASDTKSIYADDWPAYNGIEDADTKHETVNHSVNEWVKGDVHTNSIENIWSVLKHSIVGSYHQVSKKHLDSYLDELEWRFNNRENPYLFRDTLLKLINSENLPYEKLVG